MAQKYWDKEKILCKYWIWKIRRSLSIYCSFRVLHAGKKMCTVHGILFVIAKNRDEESRAKREEEKNVYDKMND